MKSKLFVLLAFPLFFVFSGNCLVAQSFLSGKAYHDFTEIPIENGMKIFVPDCKWPEGTNASSCETELVNGMYILRLPLGKHIVHFEMDGNVQKYEVEMEPGLVTQHDIYYCPRTMMMPEVAVNDTLPSYDLAGKWLLKSMTVNQGIRDSVNSWQAVQEKNKYAADYVRHDIELQVELSKATPFAAGRIKYLSTSTESTHIYFSIPKAGEWKLNADELILLSDNPGDRFLLMFSLAMQQLKEKANFHQRKDQLLMKFDGNILIFDRKKERVVSKKKKK